MAGFLAVFRLPQSVAAPFLKKRQSASLTSGIEYRPLPVDDPKVRQPDIKRARTLLGWEPKVPFDKGIVRTIEYFRGKV
jgi:nucleoside-diphosphate-sugar epimerase